jgi:hypothetical protein
MNDEWEPDGPIKAGSAMAPPLSFQDEMKHRGEKPKVLTCGRNIHRMGTGGKSKVHLEVARSGFSFDISFHPVKMGVIQAYAH